MKLWLLIFAVLYGLLRGFGEGMVMHFPNVRDHLAFYAYHSARLLEPLCLIAATVSWGIGAARHMFTAGVAVLMWEAFEVSYMVTRAGQVQFGHENILGIWTVDSLAAVIALHVLRVLCGLALTLKGGKDAC